MAQPGPITDVTQRLFVDLKSKNEEVRAKAAYDLYDNVLAISRGDFSIPAPGLFVQITDTEMFYRLASGKIRRILQCR